MSGKVFAIFLLVSCLLAGGWLYYLQVYGFYRDVPSFAGQDVQLMSRLSNEPKPIDYTEFKAIDADSSPIRYRACFKTQSKPSQLAQTFVTLTKATPRNAPDWFDCFNAAALGKELESGTATAFLSAKNIAFGVDRITAISEDGHGFVWHELNDCGTKSYDGTVTGEECPARPEAGS